MRKQKLAFLKLSRKNLKELAEVSQAIEKKGLPEGLLCKKLGRGLGHGIFLHPGAAPIPKGQLIAAYSGTASLIRQNVQDDGSYAFTPLEDIHLKKEEQRAWDSPFSYHPSRFYSLKIDALKKGNFTRFVNHSAKPNVVARVMAVPRNRFGLEPSPIEIIYFAKKRIAPGEQLLLCYEDEEETYWGVTGLKPFSMTPKTFTLNEQLQVVTSK